jgi:phospholipase/carboxylesterase
MRLIHAAFEPAGEGPFPTLIALHGWGSNALDLLGLAPYIAGGRFLVLCPQGPVEVAIGAVNGYGWYPLTMGSAPDEAAVDAALNETTRFIDDALERYPVERRKLVLLGFSQGGTMAFNLAVRHPERFAALAAISTWFPEELSERVENREALERMPTLVQHGRADNMIEIARARRSVENLRALRLPLTYREYDCGHEITVDGLKDLSNFLIEKVVQPIITL